MGPCFERYPDGGLAIGLRQAVDLRLRRRWRLPPRESSEQSFFDYRRNRR